MRKLYFVAVLVLLGIMAGCGPQKKKQFDGGTFRKGTYHNEFFGFSITVPDNMTALKGEKLNAVANTAKNLIEDSHRGQNAIRAINNRGGILLQITDTLKSYNVVITAEDLQGLSVKNIDQYMASAISQLDLLNLNYRPGEEGTTAVMIGGREFLKASFRIVPDSEETLFQDFYGTVIDGFAILLTTTYLENYKNKIDGIINTLKFDK